MTTTDPGIFPQRVPEPPVEPVVEYGSPAASSQPREQSVICYRCLSRRTWNINALCDSCSEAVQYRMCPVDCGQPPAHRVSLMSPAGWQITVTGCSDHASMILEFLEGFTQGEEMPMSVEKLGS